MRECDDKALLVIHIFKDGANPPVENYSKGWNILETFGSNLDDDFQGKAFLLSK
jgi:alpha-galactosidase